jgi:23S rRNA pseudouridine2605 synthase
MKKQFGRSSSGDKPFRKKSGAGSGKPDFSKKKFSDKKSGGDKPFKKSFGGDRERSSGDKPFKKSFGGDRERTGDKPFKKSFGGDRERTGDKPFKKSFGGDRERSGGDKPFKKSFGGDRERSGDKPFKKSFGGDRERSGGDRPFKKSFGGDKERGADRPFKKSFSGDKERGGDRSDYAKKASSDRPFKKSFGGDRERSGGDKPFKKSFGGDRERSGDKPFKKSFGGDRERSGDKSDYAKKASSDRPDYTKKSSFGRSGTSSKPFRKRDENQTGFTGRKFADRDTTKGGKNTEEENWQVFENADDAKEFIKSNRDEKRSSGKSSQRSPKEYKNDNRPLRVAGGGEEGAVRLNRFIANTGICSRREADDLIEAGVVKVNGKIVTELGIKVNPGDTVHYGDQLLRREKMAYVLLNKPKDYITTTDDPQERKTVMQLVEDAGDVRIYPVGRLDRNTTGLLLFTNDGDLAERLTHPKNGVRKIYHVSLDKNLRTDDFDKILKGYEMEDGFMKADELSFVGDGMDKKEVGIVIHSGRNRIVRRLFETLGYDVVRLDRVSYAGLTKKNLPRGKFRHLTTEEVGMLRMQIGGEKKTNFKKSDSKHTKGKRK